MVSNLIIMSGCTEVFSSSLLDEELMTLGMAAQPVDPTSLDQLLHFTKNKICRADGDWSMDYWEPYGLDEVLLCSVAMGVPTSTPPETPPPVCARHDVTDVLRPLNWRPEMEGRSSNRCWLLVPLSTLQERRRRQRNRLWPLNRDLVAR
uniref:Uncharacterized protein n=1 Tax=Timema cristinae TaxID=61476 RepID=A0A7R9DQ04_TIMCR|nr:unnamed protein product [Timema cristinae]